MNWAVIREPTIVVTAVVYGMLGAIAALAGLFGIWLGVLLLLSFWRYCYSVLLYFARGYKRIPPPDLASFNPVGNWAYVFHFVAFPGLILATAPYQPIGLAIAVLLAFVFPASAALMALSSSLSYSLNPAALIEFARTIGKDYRTLVVHTVLIVAATMLVQRFVIPSGGFLAIALPYMIVFWAAFAIFGLIGSVLRVHRLEFEIAGELVPQDDRVRRQQHDAWRKDLDIAYAALRSGMLTSGYNTLHKLAEANGDSLEINHWMFDNMLEWHEKKFALEVGAKLVTRLLAVGDGAGALELFQRCRRRDPDFRLPREQALALAAHAEAFGRTGLANELNYGSQSTEDS